MIKQGRDGRIMQQNGGRMPGGPPSSLGRTQHPSSTVHYGQIIAPQGYAQGYTDPREQYEREVYDRDQRDPRDPREQVYTLYTPYHTHYTHHLLTLLSAISSLYL
jgi:hypothetical protein